VFEATLPHVCCKFAACLKQPSRVLATILLHFCCNFAASLLQVCRMFAASLLQVCSNFVTLNPNPYHCVMCVQVVNIFRVAVLGGPQNQPLTGPNAHLQECGNDGVGAPDGRPRLIGYSDRFAVLREDA
jgi:hypothetical protein